MKIGLIGCGRMGAAMAARLEETGAPPLCWDADAGARERMAATGAPVATSPRALAAEIELLILSLPNAAAVRDAMAEVAPA
ncbi:MAG: NAD(P)-binding domain-containing protein, partial [Pseudomonadota bacterium]